MSQSNICSKGGSCVYEKGLCIGIVIKLYRTTNELQLVVLQEYRLEAMCGAHIDAGHLGLKWMLDIL